MDEQPSPKNSDSNQESSAANQALVQDSPENEKSSSSIASESAEAPPPEHILKHQVEFRGSGGELFKIFISNLFFSIITLGIYRFWAKARVLRYFYGATEVYGNRLQFHGTGKELFLGFLKAFAALVILFMGVGLLSNLKLFQSTVGEFFFLLMVYASLFPLIVLALIGARRYRMSRTSWRSIHFRFDGTYKELFMLLLWGVLFTIVTLGWYYPRLKNDLRAFWTDQSRFGEKHFRYEGDAKKLRLIYIPGIILWWFIMAGYVGIFVGIPVSTYKIDQEAMERIQEDLMSLEVEKRYESIYASLEKVGAHEIEGRENFEQALIDAVGESNIELLEAPIVIEEESDEELGQEPGEELSQEPGLEAPSETEDAFVRETSFKEIVLQQALLPPDMTIMAVSGFVILFSLVAFQIYSVWLFASLERYFWGHTSFGKVRFASSLTGRGLFLQTVILYLTIIVTLVGHLF